MVFVFCVWYCNELIKSLFHCFWEPTSVNVAYVLSYSGMHLVWQCITVFLVQWQSCQETWVLSEVEKSLVYMWLSVTPKEWNCRLVKKKSLGKVDLWKSLRGKYKAQKLLSKTTFSTLQKNFLLFDLTSGLLHKGTECLSTEAWEVPHIRSQ